MSKKASDLMAKLIAALEISGETVENWINHSFNELAFRVMCVRTKFHNNVEFGSPLIEKMEWPLCQVESGVVALKSSAVVAVVDANRPASVIAVELFHAIDDLEAVARGRGEIHPPQAPWVREHVFKLTNGKCAYCDAELERGGNDDMSFFVEHVVPRCAGGPDNLANYVPSCRPCNSSKNGSHVLEFIDRRFPGRRRAVALAPISAPTTPEAALALFVEAA